jgi:hypothetical protein
VDGIMMILDVCVHEGLQQKEDGGAENVIQEEVGWGQQF